MPAFFIASWEFVIVRAKLCPNCVDCLVAVCADLLRSVNETVRVLI